MELQRRMFSVSFHAVSRGSLDLFIPPVCLIFSSPSIKLALFLSKRLVDLVRIPKLSEQFPNQRVEPQKDPKTTWAEGFGVCGLNLMLFSFFKIQEMFIVTQKGWNNVSLRPKHRNSASSWQHNRTQHDISYSFLYFPAVSPVSLSEPSCFRLCLLPRLTSSSLGLWRE